MKKTILLVDDEVSVAQRLSAELVDSGYEVIHVLGAEGLVELVRDSPADVIVLDRMIGDEDSATRIAGWREVGINAPILILSSMVGLSDRIDGLDAGADAYMTKPVDIGELNAKLKALLRMGDRHSAGSDPDVIKVGGLSIDRRRREGRINGRLVALHPREFKLLEELSLRAGTVVERSTLLENVWNLRFDPRTKLIESHMSRLRPKLDGSSVSILTVRGRGYCLCDGTTTECR